MSLSEINFGGSGIVAEIFSTIRALVPVGGTILELGAGDVSTPALTKFYTVYSVEDNPVYVGKYPSNYILAPLVDGWYDADILRKKLPSRYDLILLDGPVGHPNARMGFINNIDLFDTKVPIIVDDVWRDTEREIAETLSAKVQRPVKWNPQFAVV